ncbi:uncharacterized protein L203_102195 [Cryptococcus depauperatus CBS 7841]|uniref:Uncharacterized protein n=1 Tax=Cryptococcus depauperatus CBS 7841 TaxID=1295531 RepID=A0A1E3ITL3_9TREE|nr:hypothetical protein L203_01450 [Cryptococcus depauperatus CBS 7841]
MKIDITSDVTCAFCLIGLKQLLAAIETYKANNQDVDFNIRFLPYQLNPQLTESPISKLDFYKMKFGEEKTKRIVETLPAKYASVGCKCDSSGAISSTHLAHRLQTYTLCYHPSSQLPLALDVLMGYHSEGKHPSDKSWLSSLAVKHGIFENGAKAKEWLDGNECDVEVNKAYVTAKRLGVTGVPFFVFQDKYAASGAMGTKEFVNLLEEVQRRENILKEKPMSVLPTVDRETCILSQDKTCTC